jgi:hypothetical protein
MKPDAGLIVAVHRVQTGAEVHKLNNLLHQYVCACHTENRKLADRARHELIAVVTEKESKTSIAMTRMMKRTA